MLGAYCWCSIINAWSLSFYIENCKIIFEDGIYLCAWLGSNCTLQNGWLTTNHCMWNLICFIIFWVYYLICLLFNHYQLSIWILVSGGPRSCDCLSFGKNSQPLKLEWTNVIASSELQAFPFFILLLFLNVTKNCYDIKEICYFAIIINHIYNLFLTMPN